ncbi:uncharacterized protein LOC123292526 [Chrysoperla carnea]|uniref:uncharacterized protein LOC123292526 n=1 Tax=Chrysoperla carnea TaxID=189513 RepID=UPI001D07C051|nr:uncharacterized protein LOC123292526 [Chrysoperla carnea]
MPRRKRGGDLASSAAKRRKKKESRRNETEEEHEARLQNQRTRMRQIYHKIGSLLPMSNEDHKFLQVYFIGNEEQEIDQRCTNFNGLRREIIQDVQRILHKYNQLIYIFKTTLDRMISDDYKIVIRADKRPRGEHERRFNAPQVDEVAIVVVDNENTSRDIIVHRRRKGLQRIAETHRSYDALQYPLIFLHGEDGYQTKRKDKL